MCKQAVCGKCQSKVISQRARIAISISTKFELSITIIHKFGDFKESLQVAAPLLLLTAMLALCSVALGHFQQGIAHEWAHSGRL